MATMKTTVEKDMGVGEMQVVVIPATRRRMIIAKAAAVDEMAIIMRRMADGTIKERCGIMNFKLEEKGSGMIRIGTLM